MTNEEAVKYFKRHIDLYCVTGICRDAEIMAIKALSQQTEYHGTEDMDGLYYCPICQQTTTVFKDGDKCPKCGATMDELSTREQTEDAISRQAAIDGLYNMHANGKEGVLYDHEHLHGLEADFSDTIWDAVEVLEELPSVTPKAEPCEDVISRQAAIEAVEFGITYATGVNMETGEVSYPFAESNHELRKAIHRICELPLVTPKQRTGRWIMSDDGLYRPICNNCGAHPWKGYIPTVEEAKEVFKYCPNCGAKMVEPQESEVSDADSD